MERSLSLSYEEAAALLDMVLFTYLESGGEAGDTAVRKLSNLCREFSVTGAKVDQLPVSREFTCAG